MQFLHPERRKRVKVVVLLMLFGFFLYRIDLFYGLLMRFFAITTAFMFGLVLALLFNLPLKFFERFFHFFDKNPALRHVKRPLSLTLSVLLVSGIVLVLLVVIIPEVVGAVERLISRIPDLLTQLENWLAQYSINLRQILGFAETDESNVRDAIQRATNFLMGGINYSSNVVMSAAQMVVNVVVGLIFAIYLLYSKERIKGQLSRLTYAYLPPKPATRALEIIALTTDTYSKFLGGQCLQAFISSVIVWACMAIFGFPYAILVALITSICAFIPIFGPYIAGVLGALLVYTAAPHQTLWFLLMYLIVQQLEGSLIYPRILSNAIDIPSIWVLVAVTIGGGIMGIAGMLLFIPLFAVAYRLLAQSVRRRTAQRQAEAADA